MSTRITQKTVILVSCISFVILLSVLTCNAADQSLNICKQVSNEQLNLLYKKPLIPKESERGCFWSKDPGGMAYFDINIHKYRQELRSYFNKDLPTHVKLEKVTGLGEEGLMTLTEGSLGVIVIRKGDWVLQSAVTFLDIEPGSQKHKCLWDIYRAILETLK